MTLKYSTFNPSEAVKDVVRFYWLLESDEPYTHHAMAGPCPELLFHYRGRFHEVFDNGGSEPSFVSGISAPTTLPRKFTIDEGFGMFGIYLYPHAIPVLFDVPANELTNQMVDLDRLSKTLGPAFEDRMMNSNSTRERIQVAESFILRRLQQKHMHRLPVVEAMKLVLHARADLKVKELSSLFSISERQLQRQFVRYTGFTPQQFLRISRFQKALHLYGSDGMRLTDIALECGYTDQSHFIRDFKQFSGISPKKYFKEKIPYATFNPRMSRTAQSDRYNRWGF